MVGIYTITFAGGHVRKIDINHWEVQCCTVIPLTRKLGPLLLAS